MKASFSLIYDRKTGHQNVKLWCYKGHYQESEKSNHSKGEIFANHVSDKDLLTGIHTKKKKKNPLTIEQ